MSFTAKNKLFNIVDHCPKLCPVKDKGGSKELNKYLDLRALNFPLTSD